MPPSSNSLQHQHSMPQSQKTSNTAGASSYYCTMEHAQSSPMLGAATPSKSPVAHRVEYVASPVSHPVPGSPMSHQNSPKPATRTVDSPAKPPSNSRMIAVAPFCPPQMRRLESWSLKDYALVKEIGAGAASVVYHAFCRKSAMPVALKIYKKRKLGVLNLRQVEREIQIHIQIQHSHIIDLYGAFEDDSRIYLVMQYAAGGDLFDELRRLGGRMCEKDTVCTVLVPFLKAMSHLHERGVIHRDIKPENTLFDQNRTLKIADFGLSINSVEERPVTRLGTLDYMAPEVLICPDKKRPEDNKDNASLAYGGEVDAWGVGVLTYELLVGRPPFAMAVRDSTMDAIMTKDPRFPNWMSEGAKDFVRRALDKTPAMRPTVHRMLRHPWILSYCGPPRAMVQVCWGNSVDAASGMIPGHQVSAQRVVAAAAARSSAQEMEDARRMMVDAQQKKPGHPGQGQGQGQPMHLPVTVLVGEQRPGHNKRMDSLHCSFSSMNMSDSQSKLSYLRGDKVSQDATGVGGVNNSAASRTNLKPLPGNGRQQAGGAVLDGMGADERRGSNHQVAQQEKGGASITKTLKKQFKGGPYKNFLNSFRELSKKGRAAAASSPRTAMQQTPLLTGEGEQQHNRQSLRAGAVGASSFTHKDTAVHSSLNMTNPRRKEAMTAAAEAAQVERATARLMAGRTDAVVHIRNSFTAAPPNQTFGTHHHQQQHQVQHQQHNQAKGKGNLMSPGSIAAYHPTTAAGDDTLQLVENSTTS